MALKTFLRPIDKCFEFLRLQILNELLDAVSGNTTDDETHLHNDAAHVVQGVGLSNVTTEIEDDMTPS